MGDWWGQIKNTMEKVEFCPDCKNVMELNKVIDEKTAIMKCAHCGKQEKYVYEEKTFPSNINSFSWGAFVLWPYWGFGNKMGYLFFVNCFLSLGGAFFPVFFYILILFLSIFLGLKGKHLSWKNKDWESPERFEKVQRRWDLAGKTVIGVMLVLFVLLFIM